MPSQSKYTLVESTNALLECCKELKKQSWIAVDTEFMREKTYFPQLSLIQVGIPGQTWCIDPLAIDDLSPLTEIFTNRDITKVFHSASQDMEVLYYSLNAVSGPLFDTQIAASMLGHGEQVGYGNLVKALLNIELSKTQSRTDWSRRPLSEAQLSYAADDVIHLCALYERLRSELDRKKRTQWLDADFAQLEDPSNFQPSPDRLLKRVKGHQRLRPRQQAIARELAIWREDRAKHSNKPRKWILGDEIILDLAKQTPDNIEALKHIRGLHENTVRHNGKALLAAIARGLALDEAELPRPPKKKKLSAEQQVLVDVLTALTSHAAQQADISATLLATRKDLEKVALGEDSPVRHGWRKKLAGELLEEFVSGNTCLRVVDGKIRVT